MEPPNKNESPSAVAEKKPRTKVAIFLNNGIKIVGALPDAYDALVKRWAEARENGKWFEALTLPFERQTQAELMYFKASEIVLFCITEIEPEGRIIRAMPDLPDDLKRELKLQ